MATSQVVNLTSCAKMAAAFVSLEGAAVSARLAGECRRLPPANHHREDLLQMRRVLLHSALEAVSALMRH